MKRLLLIGLLYIVTAALLIPSLITLLWNPKTDASPVESGQSAGELVDAGDLGQELITEISGLSELESYIVGVVAAEMPALFPVEALKAQAVAARTYAVRKMEEMGTGEVPVGIGQAYIDQEQRRERFGEHFLEYEKRITDAVMATQNEIMVYEDQPILAVFHAQSAGQTETAENIWSSSLPYLKSVDSSADQKAPNFETETPIPCNDAVAALKNEENPALNPQDIVSQMKILSRSPAGYVTSMDVAGRIMTGRQVREALGLRSTNFTYRQQGDAILFTTKGYGHGAGMSQYGAKFMADEGADYKEILNHYYDGIQFKKMDTSDEP